MTFLETILNDLNKLDITYEEHYDPGGMQLFVIHTREEANPTLTYSGYNANQVLLSIFIIHSPPHFVKLQMREKHILEHNLKELGLQIGLLHKIGIQQNVFHASMGIILNSTDYDLSKLKAGMQIVMQTYDDFIERAIDILYR